MSPECRAHGLPANDAVVGEVALAQHSTESADVGSDGVSELAAVQLARALVSEHLERAREVRLDETIAG